MATSRAPLRFADAVSATVSESAKSGFFFDFDGTIAPILRDPAAVFPVPGAVERLRVLAGLVSRVAIVSARPAAFLSDRFAAVPQVRLYGLYGMQTVVDGQVRTDAEARPWAPHARPGGRRPARPARRSAGGGQGAARGAALPDGPGAARRGGALGLDQGGRAGPARAVRPHGGRAASPVEHDKGTVVEREAETLTRAWYFGDDLSDGRAFDVLRDRELRDPAFLGVRVAVANGETGDELARRADFTVSAPEDTPTCSTT
ncbi:trehalose-phosphatase [Nonomuraea antimicrobica]